MAVVTVSGALNGASRAKGAQTSATVDPHSEAAAALTREKFLPVTRHALMERLTQPNLWPNGDCVDARRFMRKHYSRTRNGRPSGYFLTIVCPPKCIELPDHWQRDDKRTWGLPRQVFQEMFIRRTRHLAEIDTTTFRIVRAQRTEETLDKAV